eukprot:g5308.t1
MKIAFCFLAATASASLINDPEAIKALNADGDTWVAGANPFFEGKTWEDVSGLLGTTFPSDEELAALHAASDLSHLDGVKDPPASFDSRDQWGDLIQPIRDQQQCGSCWAFSAAEVLSDRFSIATNTSVVLSPEDSVSCDKGNMGCNGGMLPAAWRYLAGTGIVTDACFPYTAGGGSAPACATSCKDSEDWATAKHKSQTGYALNTVEAMQKEIMTNGPIQVAFTVYASFMNYKSGVYKKKPLEILPKGGHAVKIVGWGTDPTGGDYWLVANSWNTSWGDSGFFKIVRGSNQCGIEKKGPPYAGQPAL